MADCTFGKSTLRAKNFCIISFLKQERFQGDFIGDV